MGRCTVWVVVGWLAGQPCSVYRGVGRRGYLEAVKVASRVGGLVREGRAWRAEQAREGRAERRTA